MIDRQVKTKLLKTINDTTLLDSQEIDNIFYQLEKNDYCSQPVSINVFIQSLKLSNESNSIYPFWVKHLQNIYSSTTIKTYTDILFTGAVSIGKSLVPLIGMAYEIYLLLNHKNPQILNGLLNNSPIVFTVYCRSEYHCDQNINNMVNIINGSEFLKNNIITTTSNTIKFRNNITFKTIYKQEQLVFDNIFSAYIDLDTYDNDDPILTTKLMANIYDYITSRMIHKKINNTMFKGSVYMTGTPSCINHQFTDNKLIHLINDNHSQHSDYQFYHDINIPIWHVKDHTKNIYSGKMFCVCLGNETILPFIVENSNNSNDNTIIDNTTKCIDIPIEYYHLFKQDILKAIRDIAGQSVLFNYDGYNKQLKLNDLNKELQKPQSFKTTSDLIKLLKQYPNDMSVEFGFFDIEWTSGISNVVYLNNDFKSISLNCQVDIENNK